MLFIHVMPSPHIGSVAWMATFALTVLDWRNGKSIRPRDSPFTHPTDEPTEMDEEESMYEQPSRKSTYEQADSNQSPFSDNNRYAGVPSVGPSTNYASAPQLPRQSFDAYGAFSDPAPSGFAPPSSPPPDPALSRTMQYADPYARVRTAVSQAPAANQPPSYSSYGGYQ